MRRVQGKLTLVWLIVSSWSFASAHEVDHYHVPANKDFQDLGDYWNTLFHQAVRGGVESLNRDIDIAQKVPVRALRDVLLAHYHSPDTVAWRVRQRLPNALFAIEGLELKLRMGLVPGKEPGQIQGFRSPLLGSSFSHVPTYPDPRQISRISFMRCSLIKVHDTYIGTDKVGHFIGMGYLYYLTYRASVRVGNSDDDAIHHAIQIHTYGPISENAFLGMIPTGIVSNGDMAANYLGLKYFMNLTQPVTLQGCRYPPMLELHGPRWRLGDHVGPRGEYFATFISEHLDEALNPSVFEQGMYRPLADTVRKQRRNLLERYAGDDPSYRSPEYFDRVAKRCSTYFGEDYGYSGESKNMIRLSEICFTNNRGQPGNASEVQVASYNETLPSDTVSVVTVGPRIHYLGESETYLVGITHRQKTPLRNVTVTVNLPAGMVAESVVSAARYEHETNSLTWRIPRLEGDATKLLRFTAQAITLGSQLGDVVLKHDAKRVRVVTQIGVVQKPTRYADAGKESPEAASRSALR